MRNSPHSHTMCRAGPGPTPRTRQRATPSDMDMSHGHVHYVRVDHLGSVHPAFEARTPGSDVRYYGRRRIECGGGAAL